MKPEEPNGSNARRFYEKVEFDTNGGCWLWAARCDDKMGYGQFRLYGRHWAAHRASWALHRGPIPEGGLVLHKCDVPSCVNPDHLFVGTQAENIADMIRKGRHARVGARGEQSGHARLNTEAVRAMRVAYMRRSKTKAEMARELGLGETTVRAAVNGTTWRHVPMPTLQELERGQ